MSHDGSSQRGGKAAAASSGANARGASNNRPEAKAAADQTDAMRLLMRAQFFAQQQAQIKQKMRAIRTRYSGRSGRYSKADTDEMARLGDALGRAQRFISPGDADPDAVSGKRGQNPADSIAQNAHHPLLSVWKVFEFSRGAAMRSR